MKRQIFLILVCAVFALVTLLWGFGQGWAQSAQSSKEPTLKQGKVTSDDVAKKFGKVTQAERKAAAQRARGLGLKPGIAGLTAQAPAPATR